MDRETDLGSELLASLEEAAGIAEGRMEPARLWQLPASVDVKAIRIGTGLSQSGFAGRFGFSADLVEEWEQGRRRRAC